MAEGSDLTEEEKVEAAILAEPDDALAMPTFSIIIPTWGDVAGLERTLANLITQSVDDMGFPVPRDFHIVGDGPEPEVQELCEKMLEALKPLPHIRLGYSTLEAHVGTGDAARNVGLKQAVGDWVVFVDTGTAVCRDFFKTMIDAILDNPEAKFITWDMVQLLDPVPILTNAKAIFGVDRSNGLPYVLPGCATAVKREIAQLQEWPIVTASDWVYFSLLWDKLYLVPDLINGGTKRIDTEEQINKDVVVIPWTLTVAYANRSTRKWRTPPNEEDITKLGWVSGYTQAREQALKAQSESTERAAPESVSGPQITHP